MIDDQCNKLEKYPCRIWKGHGNLENLMITGKKKNIKTSLKKKMGFDYYPFKNGLLSSYTKQSNNVLITIHLVNVSFIWLKFMVNAGI